MTWFVGRRAPDDFFPFHFLLNYSFFFLRDIHRVSEFPVSTHDQEFVVPLWSSDDTTPFSVMACVSSSQEIYEYISPQASRRNPGIATDSIRGWTVHQREGLHRLFAVAGKRTEMRVYWTSLISDMFPDIDDPQRIHWKVRATSQLLCPQCL